MTLLDRIRSAFSRRDTSTPAALPEARQVQRSGIRGDAWYHPGIGIGTSSDRIRRSIPSTFVPASLQSTDSLLAGNALAYRICSIEAEDAMRGWFRVANIDAGSADALDEEWERLAAMDQIVAASTYAKAYGSALLVIDADDGQPPETPINWSALRRVRSLQAFDRWSVAPEERERTLFGPGRVVMWRVSPSNGAPFSVHADRVIFFDGTAQPQRIRDQIDGFSGSAVLDAVIDSIKGYQITVGMAANIVTMLSQGVFKIRGLHDSIMAGAESDVRNRLAALRDSMSILGELALDAEGDEYSIVGRGATGLKDVFDAVSGGLVTDTGIPRIKLFGESPSGLGSATGADGELRQWYDRVQARRDSYYAPKLRRLAKMILWSQAIPIAAPAKVLIEWSPLWQDSEQVQAQTRLARAQARQVDIVAGVVSTDEARKDPSIADDYPDLDPAEPAPMASPLGAGGVDPSAEIEPPIVEASPDAIPDGETLISLRDAGERLGVGPGAIMSAARRGEIPAWRVGPRWRVAWSQVSAWASGGRLAPAAPTPSKLGGPPT